MSLALVAGRPEVVCSSNDGDTTCLDAVREPLKLNWVNGIADRLPDAACDCFGDGCYMPFWERPHAHYGIGEDFLQT